MNKRIWPPQVSAPAASFERLPAARAPLPPDRDVDLVMDENEDRRIERLLNQYTKEIDDLERQMDLRTPRNRRYNVNFSFAFVEAPTPVVPLYIDTKAAAVNKGTRFYVHSLEMHYTLQSTGATFNLGPVLARQFFDFEWKVRDTGSDREWQNTWLPSDFLYSGDFFGLLAGNAAALVSGNSNLEVDVRVTKSTNAGSGALFASIERHLLQVSFVGVEVPE